MRESWSGRRVVFRADASDEIGIGHIMRCLTLADELKRRGATCRFVCRAHSGHLEKTIESAGHQVAMLEVSSATDSKCTDTQRRVYSGWVGALQEVDAQQTLTAVGNKTMDWLVVDHYGIDATWERSLSNYARRLLVIDDLADRRHDCDLLVDQNLGRNEMDYGLLVSPRAKLMVGPKFALLREEFLDWRERLDRKSPSDSGRILVSLGGTDSHDATSQVLNTLAVQGLPNGWRVTVVLGASAPHIESVRRLTDDMPFPCEIRTGVSNMAELMAHHDLAIGAAGSTSWERCCLGLPSLIVVTADNQTSIARSLIDAGAAKDFRKYGGLIHECLTKNKAAIESSSRVATTICDGKGVHRVADQMAEYLGLATPKSRQLGGG